VATLKQMLTVNTQFLRQMQGRYPLCKALQDAHNHTTAMMGASPERSRKRVVDPTAGTAKVQYWRSIPPMYLRLRYRILALWTTETTRMQDLNQIIVTFLLIHQLDRRETDH
jgi:hypothetical protein